jgi:phosphate transport system substrate-binding protein
MRYATWTVAALATVAFAGDALARDQIRVVGSSTVFPFASTVVERFGQKTEFPTPVIESTGSGGGIKLFCAGLGEGHPDITNASRKIKDSELEACAGNGVEEVTEVKIGYDGIVLANSRESEPLDVTIEQLWQALAKEVPVDGQVTANPYRNWSDIDGSLPDRKIEVYGPPPTSGTRDAFVELVMEAGCEGFEAVGQLDEERRSEVCATMREDGAFIEAGENDNLIVQRLSGNPDAFGVFGFSFLDQNLDTIQGAAVNGAEPSFENIASGEYPVSRSLYFYVKNGHVGAVPGIQEYVAEFVSEDAIGPDGYLLDKGLIPLDEAELGEVRKTALSLTPMNM